MTRNKQIRAIIWDYDGTLADTQLRNLCVTRKLIADVTGRDAAEFLVLQSLENYKAATRKSTNWRELYALEFAMTTAQTDQAGWLWAEYQLTDQTPVPFYPGIREVLATLYQFPHGIVSQNSSQSIACTLRANNLAEYFRCIIGFAEVELQRQKPDPDGLLLCIERLIDATPGQVLYIGDHETDMHCARNANLELQQRGFDIQVTSIGVSYDGAMNPMHWNWPPDYIAATPYDILRLVDLLQNQVYNLPGRAELTPAVWFDGSAMSSDLTARPDESL
jgi:HAD superfamily hydrolase (TIGR01549 family)